MQPRLSAAMQKNYTRRGMVVASPESYKTKAGALNGVESVKKNADSDASDLTEEA